MPTVAANFRKVIQNPITKPKVTNQDKENNKLNYFSKHISDSQNIEEIKEEVDDNSNYPIQTTQQKLTDKYNEIEYKNKELQDTKKIIHDRNPIAKLFLKFKSLFTMKGWNGIVDKKSQIKSENCIAAGNQAIEVGSLIIDAKRNDKVGGEAKEQLGNLIGGTGADGNKQELQHYEMKNEKPVVYYQKNVTDKSGNVIKKEWVTEQITEKAGWTLGSKERYVLPQTPKQSKIVNIIEVIKEPNESGVLVTSYKLYMTTKDGDNIKPIKESKCILNSQLDNDTVIQSLDNINLAIKAEEQNIQRLNPLTDEEKELITTYISNDNLQEAKKQSKMNITLDEKEIAKIKKDIDRLGNIPDISTKENIQTLFNKLQTNTKSVSNEDCARIISACGNYQGHLFFLKVNFYMSLHNRILKPENLKLGDEEYQFKEWNPNTSSITVKHTCPIIKNGLVYDEKFQVESTIKVNYNSANNSIDYEVTSINSNFI